MQNLHKEMFWIAQKKNHIMQIPIEMTALSLIEYGVIWTIILFPINTTLRTAYDLRC